MPVKPQPGRKSRIGSGLLSPLTKSTIHFHDFFVYPLWRFSVGLGPDGRSKPASPPNNPDPVIYDFVQASTDRFRTRCDTLYRSLWRWRFRF